VNALDADIADALRGNWGRERRRRVELRTRRQPCRAAWSAVPRFGARLRLHRRADTGALDSRSSLTRQHGVGQELLGRALEKAKAAGHTQVSLSVEKDSPRSPFYERNGFTPTGESEAARHGAPAVKPDKT